MSDERTPLQNEGWKQWSQNVKDTLDKLENKVGKLEDRITKHREESLVEVSTLKVKAGLMGMIAGVIGSAVMSVVIGLTIYHFGVGGKQQIYTAPQPAPPSTTEQPLGYMPPPLDMRFYYPDNNEEEIV